MPLSGPGSTEIRACALRIPPMSHILPRRDPPGHGAAREPLAVAAYSRQLYFKDFKKYI